MKTSLKLIVLGGMLIVAGCGDRKPTTEESYMSPFVPDGEVRRVTMIQNQQAAVGAREDGMLYAFHFDGKDLNSLGRDKLASIVEADSVEPISIYLEVKPDTFDARKASVVAYLQDSGVVESHMKLVQGINPSTLNPVADGLTNYGKTDTAATASAGSSANSNTASSGSGATK
ncbi:hypothetical protein BH10PLA1_BH10PLA1_11220 [soil metagenome]